MPNRIIKESVCYSGDIDQLSAFEETVFYRLIVNCDDYGRIDARPSFLKSKLFVTKQGITDKNVNDAVNKLASVGLVRLYNVDEKPFLLFPKWGLHQRVRNSKERYPAPNENDCGYSRQFAADCGLRVQARAGAESNPIQSESESESESESTHARRQYGQYGWVKLTDDEYAKLLSDLGKPELIRCIEYVDESAQGNGNKNKWKDWNLVIRRCNRDGWGNQSLKSGKNKSAAPVKKMTPEEELADLERMKRFLDKMQEEP